MGSTVLTLASLGGSEWPGLARISFLAGLPSNVGNAQTQRVCIRSIYKEIASGQH